MYQYLVRGFRGPKRFTWWVQQYSAHNDQCVCVIEFNMSISFVSFYRMKRREDGASFWREIILLLSLLNSHKQSKQPTTHPLYADATVGKRQTNADCHCLRPRTNIFYLFMRQHLEELSDLQEMYTHISVSISTYGPAWTDLMDPYNTQWTRFCEWGWRLNVKVHLRTRNPFQFPIK